MDLSALGHSLKPRAGKGLVAIAPDRKDRSAKRVALTPAGVNKLRQTKRLWREAQDQFEAAFGAKRAKEMREILASLSTSEFAKPSEDRPSPQKIMMGQRTDVRF